MLSEIWVCDTENGVELEDEAVSTIRSLMRRVVTAANIKYRGSVLTGEVSLGALGHLGGLSGPVFVCGE